MVVAGSPILGPVAVLVLWSLIVLGWAALTRFPAAAKLNLGVEDAKRTREFNDRLPAQVQYKMDNYMHLMEQPVLFYATALGLALAGIGSGVALWLAWAYVGLRIVHSIVHGTSNKVSIRFPLFMVATVCLIVMAFILAFAVI